VRGLFVKAGKHRVRAWRARLLGKLPFRRTFVLAAEIDRRATYIRWVDA
jgi:hypothetical protein